MTLTFDHLVMFTLLGLCAYVTYLTVRTPRCPTYGRCPQCPDHPQPTMLQGAPTMPNHNKVQLIGNLTRDPQIRKVSDQASVCQFGLATSRTYRDRQGDTQDETTFVDLEAWGRTGEIIHQHLAKGRPVFVEGRLRLDQWTDPDGQKRSKLKVVVESFQFLDGKPAGADEADAESTEPEEAA